MSGSLPSHNFTTRRVAETPPSLVGNVLGAGLPREFMPTTGGKPLQGALHQGGAWVSALQLEVRNSINISEATSHGKNVLIAFSTHYYAHGKFVKQAANDDYIPTSTGVNVNTDMVTKAAKATKDFRAISTDADARVALARAILKPVAQNCSALELQTKRVAFMHFVCQAIGSTAAGFTAFHNIFTFPNGHHLLASYFFAHYKGFLVDAFGIPIHEWIEAYDASHSVVLSNIGCVKIGGNGDKFFDLVAKEAAAAAAEKVSFIQTLSEDWARALSPTTTSTATTTPIINQRAAAPALVTDRRAPAPAVIANPYAAASAAINNRAAAAIAANELPSRKQPIQQLPGAVDDGPTRAEQELIEYYQEHLEPSYSWNEDDDEVEVVLVNEEEENGNNEEEEAIADEADADDEGEEEDDDDEASRFSFPEPKQLLKDNDEDGPMAIRGGGDGDDVDHGSVVPPTIPMEGELNLTFVEDSLTALAHYVSAAIVNPIKYFLAQAELNKRISRMKTATKVGKKESTAKKTVEKLQAEAPLEVSLIKALISDIIDSKKAPPEAAAAEPGTTKRKPAPQESDAKPAAKKPKRTKKCCSGGEEKQQRQETQQRQEKQQHHQARNRKKNNSAASTNKSKGGSTNGKGRKQLPQSKKQLQKKGGGTGKRKHFRK